MKKIMSIILAAIMTVSVFAISTVSAFAADVNSPTASTATDIKPTLQVNGITTTTDIKYTETAKNPITINFVYTGEGKVTGWEHNLKVLGLVDGVDYIATQNPDGSLTIQFITKAAADCWENGEVTVNALVDFNGKTNTTAKPNSSNKSPSTGVSTSVIAGSVALAGAGIAVLSATKKRDAE